MVLSLHLADPTVDGAPRSVAPLPDQLYSALVHDTRGGTEAGLPPATRSTGQSQAVYSVRDEKADTHAGAAVLQT